MSEVATDNSMLFTIRYKGNRVVMTQVPVEEVKRYFNDNDPTDYRIEVWHVPKACCMETWEYRGSFPAKDMYSKVK